MLRRIVPIIPLVLVLGLALALAPAPPSLEADGPDPVVVTNFPTVQSIAGTVAVGEPVPASRLVTFTEVVSPAGRDDVANLTDAGVLDATGFGSVVVSLAGESKGRLTAPGAVGLLLLPDEPRIAWSFETYARAQFGLLSEAPVAPSPQGIFESVQTRFELGFPRYRVFFFNETDRAAEVSGYLYLRSG